MFKFGSRLFSFSNFLQLNFRVLSRVLKMGVKMLSIGKVWTFFALLKKLESE